MNDRPVGREIGSKLVPGDQVTIGTLSGIVELIVDKQTEGVTELPADSWVQKIDKNGAICSEPYLGHPFSMPITIVE